MIDSEKTNSIDVERLIIYTVILLMILVFILQTNFSILTVIPFMLFYFAIIVYSIILPFFKNENLIDNSNNDVIIPSDNLSINVENLKKISSKNYFFNDGKFYTKNKIAQKIIAIPFQDILEVTKTSVVINNIRVWKVVAIYNNKKVTYKFKHNYSLWNSNFPDFLEELKKINPNVNISKFNLWNK